MRQRAEYQRTWKQRNRERVLANNLRYEYGLELDEFYRMVAAQNGQCKICGVIPSTRLCVDHDHKTGKIRSLLCLTCNRALGLFRDNPDTILRAFEYLKEHA